MASTKKNPKGLALSGGGYRASLFHVGSLWRLNELGWLNQLNEITSVSGGSIVSAYLGMRWSELEFDRKTGIAGNFGEVLVQPMRTMFATTIDIQTIAKGLLNPVGSASGRVNGERIAGGAVDLLGEAGEVIAGSKGKSLVTSFARPFSAVFGVGLDATAATWDALNPFPTPSESLIKTYDRLLFQGKTLQDLPDPNGNPRFTLYATNMQTGVSVRMARDYLEDYTLGRVVAPDIPLAKAVAASSGFPPFYCPVEVKIPRERWSRIPKRSKVTDGARLRERMDLGDGAVYDNLGLLRLLDNCETILVSDAGDSLDVLEALPFDWLSQVLRTLLVSMDQSNKLRVGKLIDEFSAGKALSGTRAGKPRKGAYWGISSKIKKRLETAEPPRPSRSPELLVDSEQTRAVGEMRTRLNRFTDEEQETLINWGYALADARMRRRVLEPTDEDRPGQLPFSGRLE